MSWRAAPKLYTLPGVSIRPEKKPDTCWVIKCPGTVRRPAAQTKRIATHSRGRRQRDASPLFRRVRQRFVLHTVFLVARFEIGHTQRKNRPQKAATSRFIAYRAVCGLSRKWAQKPQSKQSRPIIIHYPPDNCKCFFEKIGLFYGFF